MNPRAGRNDTPRAPEATATSLPMSTQLPDEVHLVQSLPPSRIPSPPDRAKTPPEPTSPVSPRRKRLGILNRLFSKKDVKESDAATSVSPPPAYARSNTGRRNSRAGSTPVSPNSRMIDALDTPTNCKQFRSCPDSAEEHHAGPSDTLQGLALRYRTTTAELKRLNPSLAYGRILPGQVVFVTKGPGCVASTEPESSDSALDKDPAAVTQATSLKSEHRKSFADLHLADRQIVHKLPAFHCCPIGHVRGELTLTEAMLMFEPRLDDRFVRKHGMVPFQVSLDISTVMDFRVLGQQEQEAVKDSLVSDASAVLKPLNHPSEPKSPTLHGEVHSVLRLLYMKEGVENYLFFLLPLGRRDTFVDTLEALIVKESMNRAMSFHSKDVQDKAAANDAAIKCLDFLPDPISGGGGLTYEIVNLEEETAADAVADTRAYLPKMHGVSEFLTADQILDIRCVLPIRDRFSEWVLLYSIARHGTSLQSFYSRVQDYKETVMVVSNTVGEVFGGFAAETWRQDRSYFGHGECFLFTFVEEFKKYPWTRQNNYFMLAREDSIAMGGGGHFGLYLDADFNYGSSGVCATFNDKEPLTSREDFKCKNFEVWGLKRDVDDIRVLLPDDEFQNWTERCVYFNKQ